MLSVIICKCALSNQRKTVFTPWTLVSYQWAQRVTMFPTLQCPWIPRSTVSAAGASRNSPAEPEGIREQ